MKGADGVFIKRRQAGQASPHAKASPGLSKELTARFSALIEFLTVVEWSAGVPRQPGTVLLFCDGGLWKLWVNDKDSDRSAFVTGPDVLSLLESVERGLREDTLDWRASKRPQKAQR